MHEEWHFAGAADPRRDYGWSYHIIDAGYRGAIAAGQHGFASRDTRLDRHLPETLLLESEIQDTIIGGPNQIEAIMAEMEKRDAQFSDVASAAE